MMRYGIFSMRWASASRGSVSGSRDLLIYPSARAQPTGSLTLKIYTPYEVFPRNEVSFVDRVDTVAHSGGQIPKTAFFLARRRGNICCDLDQRLRSNPVFFCRDQKNTTTADRFDCFQYNTKRMYCVEWTQ